MTDWYRRPAGGRVVSTKAVFALSAAFALSAFTRTAPAQTPADKPVMMPFFAAKVNDALPYRLGLTIHSKAPTGEQVIKIAETLKTTVKELQEDGKLTLLVEFQTGTVTFGKQEINILKMLPVVTITRSPKAVYETKVEKGNHEGNAEVAAVLVQTASASDNFLPAKAVRPGDHWKIDYANANRMLGGPKMTGEAQFIGIEKVNGIEAYRIKFSADGELKPGMPGHTEGVMFWQTGQGQLLRLTQKGNGIFAGSPAEAELEVTLQSKPALPETKPEKPPQ